MNNDVNWHLRGTLTRRGFLIGGAGLAIGAVAGCGGGGSSDPRDSYDSTFRGRDEGRSVAASVTLDETGLLTYWTLFADPDAPFADFGQTFVRDDRFETTLQGVTTFGELRGDRIRGRTEDASDSSFGFNWETSRQRAPRQPEPPRQFVGTFEGSARIQGIDVVVLLGVSSDGNATFFGAFDDPDTADVDFYAFEGLSFDRFGDGYDYFLNLYEDRISLRESGGVRVEYTFDPDDASLGGFAGQTFDVPLTVTRAGTRRAIARPTAKSPGLRRITRALQARGRK